MIVLFTDKTQFFLLPAVGFTRDAGQIMFTLAFMYYGISIRVCRTR